MGTKLDEFRKTIRVRWTDIFFGMGIGFVAIGIAVWILSVVFSDISVLAVALALISLALAFIAIAMGGRSDARMKAMANLEFDERLAVMTDYTEPASSWENVLYDTRAALRLEHWADKPMKHEFKHILTKVIQQAKSDKDAGLVKALEDLWREYNIGKW